MLLVGDNLASRITAILLGSFLALAVVLGAFILGPQGGEDRESLFQLPVPQEAASIVEAVEASSSQARPLVLRALNSSAATVRIQSGFPPVLPGLRRSPRTEWMFARYSPVLGRRPFRVDMRQGLLSDLMSDNGLRPKPSISLSVQLKDGSVLVIERRPTALIRNYIARSAAAVATAAAILIAGLVLAVRQTARPVARLAVATRRFSIDGEGPDLPLKGPRELQDLSAAFNDLQRRIRDLVADRTRILAAIAHDLRTYLTRLRLRADFIADDDQRERAARDIEEMSLLIDDTLLFAEQASRPAAAAQRIDAAVEVRALIDLRQELGEAVTAAPEADSANDADDLTVRCAPLSLRRMLANLVDNAIRYGGQARIGCRRLGETVEIWVEDDGPGVRAGDLARLMQPFERLEGSRARHTGGAGLGLAIVRALAASNRGLMVVENRVPSGLRAAIRLPAAEPGVRNLDGQP
jgi:signal transduction histidine kinase